MRISQLADGFSDFLRRTGARGGGWALALLLAGLAVSALAARHVQSSLVAVAEQEFSFVCKEIQSRIEERLGDHEQILRSGAAFFADTDGVTREEWHEFAERQKINQKLPGIQGIGFALLIPRQQLAQHIRAIRAEGFPAYQVRPEGDRETYSAIIYLEPFADRNLRAFGYDMLSEPVRRSAMERARDQDAAALSGKVILVQETDKDIQPGTLMYVPVYRMGARLETVAERRAALCGWVYSPYRMTDLMQGILGRWDSAAQRRLRLEIFDGEKIAKEALLYDSQGSPENRLAPAVRMTRQKTVDSAGRCWILRFTEAGDLGAVEYGGVWLTMAGGTIISLLLSGLTLSLATTRFNALRMARQWTSDLRHSEERWTFAIEGSGDGVWDWDLASSKVFFSKRWKAMLGYEEGEIGSNLEEWSKRVHPEDLPHAMAAVKAHLDGQTASYASEHRVRCKNGAWKWILDRGLVVSRDAAGQPVRMIGTHADTTDRKMSEAALLASEERYRRLFESAKDGVLILDADSGAIVDVNPFLVALLGYTHAEFVGKQLWEIGLFKDIVANKDAYCELRDKEYVRYEHLPLETKDGRRVEVEFISNAYLVGSARVVQCNIRDISERKRMEERLLQAEKLSGIGQLAGGIAHNFNNQLTGVLGYADMLVSKLDDEVLRRYARNIVKASRRTADLTAQLLTFARKGKYLSASVDMHQVISETASLLQASIDKRIEIQQHFEASYAFVVGDPAQIKLMLMNLGLNARDAMPEGGLLVFETAAIDLSEERSRELSVGSGRYLRVSVTDTGTGMSEETKKHLFEPFFTTKDLSEGAGMGLAAVHGAVANHHGAITVQSELGTGSTFTIYLPQHGGATPAVAETPTVAEVQAKGKTHVLLVDDEDIILDLGTDMLRDLGYKVTLCKDGAEAVARYQECWQQIDLVILDVVMPVMGGREAFAAMHKINPRAKVLVSSGYNIDGEARNILEDGALAFLQKPFNRAELSRKVAEALGRSG